MDRRDCNLIGLANGGCGRSPNIDDGNLNDSTGVFSGAFKAVSEVALNYPGRAVGALISALQMALQAAP